MFDGSGDGELPGRLFVEGVFEGVFHQRLDDQFGNADVFGLFLNGKGVMKFLGITHLHDF